MMIYYDQFETWEGSFRELAVDLVGKEAIETLASSNFEFIEDAGDAVVRHTDIQTASDAIHDWLRAHEFCVFHGTRLLPNEILSVQQLGLRPLVAADRRQRLTEILKTHPEWHHLEHRLAEVIEDVGPKNKQGRREGQVHFSLSRSGLANGFDHYLSHGSEFDQHVVQRLIGDQSGLHLLHSETVPIIVHVRIGGEELVRGAHPHFNYSDIIGMGEIPGIARVFLNSWAFKVANPTFDIAKLRTDCCMMQRVATPPERIIDLEKLAELDVK